MDTSNNILFHAPQMEIRSLRKNRATFNSEVSLRIPFLEHGFTHDSERKPVTC